MNSPARVDRVAGGLRRRIDRALSVAAFLAVAWFYFWTVRTADGFNPRADFDYHNDLAQGFAHGHTYLDIVPDPRLAALPDPYDPGRNRSFRVPDASYFRGRYYLYFVPAPALTVLLPYRLLTGDKLPGGIAVLVFCLLGFATASRLWLAIRGRYFAGSSVGTGALGILMLGLGTHVLALARRPQMWELSIAGAYAGMMGALACLYWALHTRRTAPALGLAGLLLGLAVASRPTCLFGAAMFVPVLWHLWRRSRSPSEASRGFLAAALTGGVIVAGLLLYNYARFGSPLQFGQVYQLTSSNETHNRHFAPAFFAHNARLYYFFPVNWSWELPFVGSRPLPPAPPGYGGGEELYGLALMFPFLWLALAAPLAWIARSGEEKRTLRTLVGATAAAYAALSALLLCFFSANERYEVDFVQFLALLAALGLLGLERWAQGWKWTAVFGPLVAAAGLFTAVAGVLISFDYHGRSIARTAPAAWAKMTEAADRWIKEARHWKETSEGIRNFRVRFSPKPPGTVETLLKAGQSPRSERVLVKHEDAGSLRLGYLREGAAPLWSEPVTPRDGAARLQLQLPALYAPLDMRAESRSAQEAACARMGVSLALEDVPLLVTLADACPGGPQTLEMAGAGFAGGVELRRGIQRFEPDNFLSEKSLSWTLAGPPPSEAGRRIPLITMGRPGGGDALMLQRVRPGIARLVYHHAGGAELQSGEMELADGANAVIEVEHEPRWPWSQPAAATRSLVVWVNGRLAWETRVPAGEAAQGEIFFTRNGVGAPGCEPAAAGWGVVAAPARPAPRGALRLRLMLPIAGKNYTQPLLVLGAPGRADLIGLRYLGGDDWKICVDHWGAPFLEGQPLQLKPGQAHVVEIVMPSCVGPEFGAAAKGEVVVRIDGAEAFRHENECWKFQREEIVIGRNSVGGSSCTPAFTGWILDARWHELRKSGGL